MAKIRLLLLVVAQAFALAARAESQVGGGPDTVVVQSGALRLRALLWHPRDRGPFPAVLYNCGNWPAKDTTAGRRDQQAFEGEQAALGPLFAKHGYVFLFLFRRGTGLSAGQGANASDLLDRALAANGQEARNQRYLQLLETDELSDALAALAFLRALPEVDARRVATVGASFGGSLTVLVAERDTALAAAVDFAGAAGSWEASPPLRARLLTAVGRTRAPVFFIHAANDYSVAPGQMLAAEMARLGKPHRLKVYPPFGRTAQEGHRFVFLGVATWGPDVFAFLDERTRR